MDNIRHVWVFLDPYALKVIERHSAPLIGQGYAVGVCLLLPFCGICWRIYALCFALDAELCNQLGQRLCICVHYAFFLLSFLRVVALVSSRITAGRLTAFRAFSGWKVGFLPIVGRTPCRYFLSLGELSAEVGLTCRRFRFQLKPQFGCGVRRKSTLCLCS